AFLPGRAKRGVSGRRKVREGVGRQIGYADLGCVVAAETVRFAVGVAVAEFPAQTVDLGRAKDLRPGGVPHVLVRRKKGQWIGRGIGINTGSGGVFVVVNIAAGDAVAVVEAVVDLNLDVFRARAGDHVALHSVPSNVGQRIICDGLHTGGIQPARRNNVARKLR